MFGYDSRSRTDIADRIETLRGEVARLSEEMADGARIRARETSRYARRQAGTAVEELADQAERFGARAGEMIASGLSAARRGRREAGRELEHVADRTQQIVARHPAASTLAVLGICAATVYMVSLAVRRSRRPPQRTSSGRPVRRASSKTNG